MFTCNRAGNTKQESQSLSFFGTSIEIKGTTVCVTRPGYLLAVLSGIARVLGRNKKVLHLKRPLTFRTLVRS